MYKRQQREHLCDQDLAEAIDRQPRKTVRLAENQAAVVEILPNDRAAVIDRVPNAPRPECLVKAIIRLHGGDISVTSAVDQFTRFSFYIPKPAEVPKLKPAYSSAPVEDAVISERPKKERHGKDDAKSNHKDGQNHE